MEVEKQLGEMARVVGSLELVGGDSECEEVGRELAPFLLESEAEFLRSFFELQGTRVARGAVRDYLPYFEEHLAVLRAEAGRRFAASAERREAGLVRLNQGFAELIDSLARPAERASTLRLQLEAAAFELRKAEQLRRKVARRAALRVARGHLRLLGAKKAKLLLPLSDNHGLDPAKLYQTLFYAAEYCRHKLEKGIRLKLLEGLFERLVDRLRLVRHRVNRAAFFELRKSVEAKSIGTELRGVLGELVALELLNAKLRVKFPTPCKPLLAILNEDLTMFQNALRDAQKIQNLQIPPGLLEDLLAAYETEKNLQMLLSE